MELTRETDCCGTLAAEELDSGERRALNWFPGASFPAVALRESPARFCLPDS